MPGDFGWEYPPGVTGNEPQIAGRDPMDGCAQCDDPFDYEGPVGKTHDGDGYLCSATCEARWVLAHAADYGPRAVLDAAGDEEDVVVRVINASASAVVGRVVGRRGLSRDVQGYVLELEDGSEREVLTATIRRVEVVEDTDA